MRWDFVVLAALIAVGCSSSAPTADAGSADAGTGQRIDAGVPDAGADGGLGDAGAPGLGYDAGPIAIPGTAAYDHWTFIPVNGAACGNGSATGIAVNPHAGATNLVVYLEGGGACWNYGLCGGGGAEATASHLDGFGAADVLGDGIPFYEMFDRGDATNPFAEDNYVFIPYCTGDVHTGNTVYTYDGGTGTLTIAHVGYGNVGADLGPVVATFPAPTRLVVAGSSAGGYGAAFNYDRIHAAFPGVPAFLIDDSGPPLRPPYGTNAWYDAQDQAWGLSANVPAGCAACNPEQDGGGLFQLLPFYAQDSSFRGSLLETEHDDVISAFYAVPPGDPAEICFADGGGPCQFETALNDLYDNVIRDAGPGQMHVYFVNDVFHTYLGDQLDIQPTGETPLKTFLWQQLGDAGPWADVLPP